MVAWETSRVNLHQEWEKTLSIPSCPVLEVERNKENSRLIMWTKSVCLPMLYLGLLLLLLLLQSCPTLCDPIDSSLPGFPVPGILQARTLEWVAISFSNAWKWKVKGKPLSRVRLFTTPWTNAYQAPLSMGFSRQEYRSGVPSPSPWVLVKMWRNWSPSTLLEEI